MAKSKATPKATVAIKVIRADGTEETFFSDDVSETQVKAAEDLTTKLREGDQP